MNYSCPIELDDHQEDMLATVDHGLDVEPNWWYELDLTSNCIE